MSGNASAASSIRRIPSPSQIKAEHHIVLLDYTASKAPSYQARTPDAERADSDAPPTPGPGTSGLYKRMTNNSFSVRQTVRQEVNKQKYARYGKDRYYVHEPSEAASDEDPANGAPRDGQEATAAQTTYLERAQNRARTLLKRKRTLGRGDDQNIVVDVLYENQRGMFFFGIPKYSSNSLLPSDPRPWQNGQFRTSAVDIRNAQVPDPSWEWAWKSWYVDMSRDVDEEGWEYSFAFVGRGATTFAWHGNHPWFHSFVRRRRWLRMRGRKETKHHTQEKGHELTAEYFTIHPKTVRGTSPHSAGGESTLVHSIARIKDPVIDLEKMEIKSVGDLFLALRKSTVDREKIRAVSKFIDEGGEELFYLSDRMEDIMGTLMFQSSRRQLLSDLTSRHEQVHKEQKELAAHEHDDDATKQGDHDRAARRADNLLKAVHAADEQVKRLEYWSDIKDITDMTAAAENEESHNEPSFKSKQAPTQVATELHKHAVYGHDSGNDTAYETASASQSKKSSVFYDTESKMSNGKESSADADSDLERYSPAPETASNISGKSKEKGKAKALDGVEERPEEEENEQITSAQTGARAARRSVQIVDPVPISSRDDDDYDTLSDGVDDNLAGSPSPPGSPVDRGEAKTPDSVAGFLKQMRAPKNWIDQAFG